MVSFYPANVHVVNELRRICGQHFGISESQIVQVAQMTHAPRMHTMTARLPNYHKVLLGDHAEIQYHLAGYGVYREEALIRLLGEAIERYALITAATTLNGSLFRASYNDLKHNPDVMPWEYIDIFTGEDYRRMAGKLKFRAITPDDKISWMWCPSLFDPSRTVCIPAQCLFTGLRHGDEIPFVTSFSKGCASHTSPQRALRSALLEAVEADALMLRWYSLARAPRVVMDDPTLVELTAEIFSELDVEIVPYDFTMPGMPGHTFAVAIMSKGKARPTVLLGTGAGLDPGQALYRALVEAVAIFYIGYVGPALQPRDYLTNIDADSHANLDSNVAYWASAEDGEAKREFMRGLVDGHVNLSTLTDHTTRVDDELRYVIGELRQVSQYAVHLDITPPDVEGMGWSVARVFLPELMQVSLPSFPYSGHPRLREFGGIRNRLPHPSP